MIVKIDQLGQEMTLIYESSIEEQQTNVSFTRSIQNAKFRKSKFSRWDGQVKFVKYGNRMAFGLWLELKRMCDRFGYPIKFEGLGNVIEEGVFTKEYITEFCKNLLQEYEFDADEEQIESVYKALKYKKCYIDGCTSFGKTLISYIIYTLLRKQNKSRKTLMITIDAGLVIQANQDFLDYCGGRFDMKLTMIHGRSKYRDIKDSRMIIGNFQTLVNLPAEFYESIDAVLIDEAHRGDTKSMKIIMEHCKNAKYKIGLSGSIKDDKHAEFYDLLSMYGPIVHRVTKRQWIDKGMAANIKINIVVLDYAPREIREELYNLKFNSSMEPDKIFVQEQRKVRESQKRLDWVSEFVGRLNGNVLVFFLDKMYGYGKNLTTSIRKKNDFKDVFYIDGDVDQDLREQYKEKMELGNNKVLVASYPTYSTGKSIKNIRHIVLAESRKSFEEISQMLGRGMRLTAGKEECIVWDLVDDYSLTTREHKYIGYMNKHMNSRITTYTDEQLEFTKKEITF